MQFTCSLKSHDQIATFSKLSRPFKRQVNTVSDCHNLLASEASKVSQELSSTEQKWNMLRTSKLRGLLILEKKAAPHKLFWTIVKEKARETSTGYGSFTTLQSITKLVNSFTHHAFLSSPWRTCRPGCSLCSVKEEPSAYPPYNRMRIISMNPYYTSE